MGVACTVSKAHSISKILWDMLVYGLNILLSQTQLNFNVLTENLSSYIRFRSLKHENKNCVSNPFFLIFKLSFVGT